LKELDYNLDLTGFDEAELSELLAEKTVGLTDEDEVPEAPTEPVTQPGDLWVPAYCDVILTRWQNFTGHEAVLDGTKHTFAEIIEQRKAAA